MTSGNVGWGGSRVGAGRKPIPSRPRFVNLGASAKAAMAPNKKCGYLVHLRYKSDHHRHMVIHSYCGAWTCPRCCKKKKEKWINHIADMTTVNVDGLSSSRASILITIDTEWKSRIVKRLYRKHADFACIRLNNGQLAVINNGGEGVLYTGDDFIATLTAYFNALNYDHKPVSTSKRWQLKGKESKHEWERLNELPVTISKLIKTLAEFGLNANFMISSNIDGVSFKCPYEWTENDILNLQYYLATLQGEESKS